MTFSPLDNIFQNDFSSFNTEFGFFFHEDSRYKGYFPNLDSDVPYELFSMYKTRLADLLGKLSRKLLNEGITDEFVDFDLNVVNKDSRLARIRDLSFGNIDTTLEEQMIKADKRSLAELGNKWGDISFTFYSAKNKLTGKEVCILSNFNYPKNLSTSVLTKATGNILNKVNGNVIGVEPRIDLLYYDNCLYLFNSNALEQIFYLKNFLTNENDKFVKSLSSVQNKLIVAKNIKHFVLKQEDINYIEKYAQNNQFKLKKVWHVNAVPGRIEKFFKNIKRLKNVNKKFNLSIRYDDKNKIIIFDHNPASVNELLRCMSDQYYLSILLNEPGIDENKK